MQYGTVFNFGVFSCIVVCAWYGTVYLFILCRSGKSSTVLYYNLVQTMQTKQPLKKRKRRPPASKLARSSSVMAFQNCSSEPMLGSEDAFSYTIARTENMVRTVSSKPTLGR